MPSGASGLGSAQQRQGIAWPMGAVVRRLHFSIYSGLYGRPPLSAGESQGCLLETYFEECDYLEDFDY